MGRTQERANANNSKASYKVVAEIANSKDDVKFAFEKLYPDYNFKPDTFEVKEKHQNRELIYLCQNDT